MGRWGCCWFFIRQRQQERPAETSRCRSGQSTGANRSRPTPNPYLPSQLLQDHGTHGRVTPQDLGQRFESHFLVWISATQKDNLATAGKSCSLSLPQFPPSKTGEGIQPKHRLLLKHKEENQATTWSNIWHTKHSVCRS